MRLWLPLLAVCVCLSCALAVPDGALSLDTGSLTVKMSAETGWTISSVTYEGVELIIPAGGQGAVMSPQSGGWYGSGYDHGETVQNLSVQVDGEPVSLDNRQLRGQTITITKESQIYRTEHTAVTTIQGATITQRHSFTLLEDIDFTHFYPFIYSVSPETTHWLGKSLDGQELGAEFDTSEDYEFNKDALWAAQYDAGSEKGILFFYPTPFTGRGSGTRMWDQPRYHKFFAQALKGPAEAGAEHSYELVMRFFSAEPDEWKETVRQIATDLRGSQQPEIQEVEGSRVYDPGVPEGGLLTLKTADYAIVISADQAWTIYSFSYRGHPIGKSTGFYGTVLVPEGGNFIGTGHTEGGREIVHNLTLRVDGEDHPIQMGETVTGEVIELVKESTIHNFRARTVVTVTDDEVIEHQDLIATEKMNLKLMYLFMHCWVNSTTSWIAETPDGEIIEGEFQSDGGFAIQRDTCWVAEYEPEMGIAILGYTPRVAHGPGSGTRLWDHSRYHKHYTRLIGASSEEIAAGRTMSYTMIVTGVADEDGSWKTTWAAANRLKAQWPPANPPGFAQ